MKKCASNILLTKTVNLSFTHSEPTGECLLQCVLNAKKNFSTVQCCWERINNSSPVYNIKRRNVLYLLRVLYHG